MVNIEKIININVSTDICNTCTTHNYGRKLYKIVDEYLTNGCFIQIDMSGVNFTSLSFYNACIGELVVKYGIDFLKNNLEFQHLKNIDKQFISKSVTYAKKVRDAEILQVEI